MNGYGGENEGFHILEEIVCQAIPESTLIANEGRYAGKNEGFQILEEFVCQAIPASDLTGDED